MAQFPFQFRRFPSALQDIAIEMENIFEQVLNKGPLAGNSANASTNSCSSGSCCSTGSTNTGSTKTGPTSNKANGNKTNGNSACGSTTSESVSVATYTPALDVVEDGQGFDLLLDLPGVSLENVKLELHEDKLHVTGTKTVRTLAQGAVQHRVERTDGLFARAVKLPKQVDTERIEATFKDGVLHIRVPKLTKPALRTIVVKSE
jgi:HSP20 family protein